MEVLFLCKRERDIPPLTESIARAPCGEVGECALVELDIVGWNEQCERHHIRIGGFLRSYLCVAEITLGGGEEVIVDLHIHRL